MVLKNNRGLTLTESLVGIVLLSALLIGTIGAFFISKMSTIRAYHRISAMNILKEYLEQEVKAGFLGGYAEGDYYVTASSAGPMPVIIDDRNTVSTSDDLTGTVRPIPYPGAVTVIGTSPMTHSYKSVGFIVEWNETEGMFGGGSAVSCSERALTYVAERS